MNDENSNGKKEEFDVYDYSQTVARELRKWCLERAFEKRDRTGVEHMEVTNEAEEYYLWITQGKSQGNSLDQALKNKPADRQGCGTDTIPTPKRPNDQAKAPPRPNR